MRPSGKITSMLPSFTALMMARSENGLSGSSAMVRTNFINGWIHQRCDMATSMAKTGRFGRIETASGASRKLTWLSAMMALCPALSMFSRPLTSSRKKGRKTLERKPLSQFAGMENAVAAIGAGKDLYGGEDRHDEQAAGNRQSGKIDGDVKAIGRTEIGGDADRIDRGHQSRRGPAEIEREQSDQHRADKRRQQHDAPGREPGGKAGADGDRYRENGEEEGNDLLGATDIVRNQRRQQRQNQRADEPEPARDDRPPPQPLVGANLLEQRAGGPEDIAVDVKIGRARRHFRDQ